MAKYLIEDSTLTAIADSIRAKSGTTEPISLTDIPTVVEEMSGGDIINGIIEEYLAATESIEANTFVEFITTIKDSKEYTISDISLNKFSTSFYSMTSCLISENTALIALYYSNIVYIKRLKFYDNETTIEDLGNFSQSLTNYCMNLCNIDGENILFTFSSNSYYIYGKILKINDDNIEYGENILITDHKGTTSGMGLTTREIVTAKIDNNIFCTVWITNDSYYSNIHKIIYEFNTSTNSVSIKVSADDVSYSCYKSESLTYPYTGYSNASIKYLNNKLFIWYRRGLDTSTNYSNGNSAYVHIYAYNAGTLETITNSQIGLHFNTTKNLYQYPLDMDVAYLDDDTYMIITTYANGSNSTPQVQAYIKKLSNGSLTNITNLMTYQGISTSWDNTPSNLNFVSGYSNNKICFVYNVGKKIYMNICNIDLNAPSYKMTTKELTNTTYNKIDYKNNSLILNENEGIYLFQNYAGSISQIGILKFYKGTLEKYIVPASNFINGITKTECTTTVPGEVWVLNK